MIAIIAQVFRDATLKFNAVAFGCFRVFCGVVHD